ncbi:MAG TPA: MFS transporter, partial [Thermomicrobiales bacterium]
GEDGSVARLDEPKTRFTGLWRHANFLRLWTGQTISQFGSQITLLALPLAAALTLHATPAEMGILSAAETAPFLLVGLFAGVWVDRLHRRPILLITDFARGVLLLAIPLAALLGALTIGLLYAVAFLVGILTVFFDVAYQSFLPALVGRAQLVEGNSKLEVSRSAAQIAGPGAAGGLVQLVTAPIAIVVDAASFFISALFLVFVRVPEPAPAPRIAGRSIWREIGEGLRVVVHNPLLRAIAGSTATSNLGGNIAQAILILYLTRPLGLGAGVIGVIFATGSVGFLCAALLAERIAGRFGLGPAIVGSIAVGALGALLIPIAQRPAGFAIPLLIASQFILGGSGTVYNINQVSLRQAITPDHLLGRMNATMRFIVWGTLPIGALIGGVLGGAIGLRPTLIVGAVIQSGAFLWTYFSPVRALREQPEEADA